MKSLQRGFTLLELIVTIAIVGIVATIALWDSSDLLENNRAESYLLELKRNISFARAKATSSDALIVVCSGVSSNIASNASTACLKDWSEGTVFVFFDANQDGNYDPKDNDITLRVMEKIPDNSRLKFTSNLPLIFDASGMITTDSGDFIYCPSKSNNDNNRELNVFASGTSLYKGKTNNTCK